MRERESAEGSSVPGVNSGHDGKCFCRRDWLGQEKNMQRVQSDMPLAISFMSHFHGGNKTDDVSPLFALKDSNWSGHIPTR